MTNKEQLQVVFSEIPEGLPVPGKHLSVRKYPVNLEGIDLSDSQVLIKNLYISLDPYLRGRMRDPEVSSYIPAFKLGEPLTGGGVSQVLKSKNPDFPVGSIVTSIFFVRWEKYTLVEDPKASGLSVIENALQEIDKIPLSFYLGILGMPGMTAYCSLKKFGKPQPGETLFVSSASGAVGQAVGQIGKIFGLKVIGIAGSDEKVKYIKELGFDEAFNYKTTDLDKALSEKCPDGVNINFENVGGKILDTLMVHMANFGRIVLCGYISEYNGDTYGIKNLMQVLSKRLQMTGFIVSDIMDEYEDEFYRDMRQWILQGKMRYKEDICDGLEKAPEKLVGIFKGENFGKTVVKVGDVEHI